MKLPSYKAGPVEYWLAEAATQFLNGAISGVKLGALIGGGTGLSTVASGLGDGLEAWKQFGVSVSGFLVTMGANGIAQVSRWHESNPFPNPYPKPGKEEQAR